MQRIMAGDALSPQIGSSARSTATYRPSAIMTPDEKQALIQDIRMRVYTLPIEDMLHIGDALWKLFPEKMPRYEFENFQFDRKLQIAVAHDLRAMVRDQEFLRYISRLPPDRESVLSAFDVFRRARREGYVEPELCTPPKSVLAG